LVIAGEDQTDLTIVALDQVSGGPLADVAVRVSILDDGPGILITQAATNSTDEQGIFRIGLQLDPDAEAGAVIQVRAEVGDASVSREISVVAPSTFGDPVPDKILLVADAVELLSSASQQADGVRISALVTDANNRLLEGVNVNFASTQVSGDSTAPAGAGALVVTRPTTDATGTAEAVLVTGSNPRTRNILISAAVDGSVVANNINDLIITVRGTALELSGPSTLGANQLGVSYFVRLTDSAGRGVAGQAVALSASDGSTTVDLTTSAITDSNGFVEIPIDADQLPSLDSTLLASVFEDDSEIRRALPVRISPVQIGFFSEMDGFSWDSTDSPPQVASLPPYDAQADVEVPLGTCVQASLEARLAGVADTTDLQEGDLIEVSSTRGTLFATLADCQAFDPLTPDPALIINTVMLGASRDGSENSECIFGAPCFQSAFFLRAEGEGGAGTALLNARHVRSGAATSTRDPQIAGSSPSLEFLATLPDRDTTSIQANPPTVPVSGEAEIVVVVRDVDNNVVKNEVVEFQLEDFTNGRLSAATAVTDRFGVASVTYVAGPVSSSLNGVRVTARLRSTLDQTPPVSRSTSLTVGERALRITLGTGNELAEIGQPDGSGSTLYARPYSVIVTDAAGNPAPPDTVFRLAVESLAYQRGCYELINDEFWAARYRVPGAQLRQTIDINGNPVDAPFACDDEAQPVFTQFAVGCINEDSDRDGIADAGEDINLNGRLEPGNVVSAPSTVDLNDNGVGFFELIYPQEVANWVRVRITATAVVQGTEAREVREVILPALADDVNDPDVSPPGRISPFGVATSCDVAG
jgi:5-hydroxyisourate hydrolase-like protein (transthyretin family)